MNTYLILLVYLVKLIIAVEYLSQPIDISSVIQVSSLPRLLDRQSIYFLSDTGTYLLHLLKLDTTYETTGLRMFRGGDSNLWLEFTKPTAILEGYGPRKALSECLDVRNGDGGGVGGDFRAIVGLLMSFDLNAGFNFAALTALIGVNGAIGKSVGIYGGYSCAFQVGSVGQSQILVPFFELLGAQYREVQVHSEGRFRKRVGVTRSAWKNPELPIRLPNLSLEPMIYCETDPSKLICDGNIGGSYLFDS